MTWEDIKKLALLELVLTDTRGDPIWVSVDIAELDTGFKKTRKRQWELVFCTWYTTDKNKTIDQLKPEEYELEEYHHVCADYDTTWESKYCKWYSWFYYITDDEALVKNIKELKKIIWRYDEFIDIHTRI
jgi:hypothetical protein